jgi:hypothetical protein
MKRQSAFSKALQEAQGSPTTEQKNSETVKPLDGETVRPSDSTTLEQQHSTTTKPPDRTTVKSELLKTSFYIWPEQSEKLDDLAHDYKKKRPGGKRIDRQDIIRALIDNTDLESLLQIIK